MKLLLKCDNKKETYSAQIAFSVNPIIAAIAANIKIPTPTWVCTGNTAARTVIGNPGYKKLTKPNTN